MNFKFNYMHNTYSEKQNLVRLPNVEKYKEMNLESFSRKN